jgi:modulator of FtsH protease HflK
MNDHPHSHDEPRENPAPETPVDAGSQALAEALHSSFKVVRLVMIVLVAAFFLSGMFTVGPQERAIVLRFGKPVGEGEKALLGPGFHFGFPPPIDEVQKVSIAGIQVANSRIGWFAITPEQELAGVEPPAGPSLNPAIDGYVLTADGNIIHSRARLFYHIDDPKTFIFNFTNAPAVVQDALDNALLFAAATFKVDDILTREKSAFQEAVKKRVTESLEKQKVGVSVERCDVQSIPPRQMQVRQAFVNVLDAEINRNKILSDAYSHTNQVLTRAEADAESLTNSAETARLQYVNYVASLATNFSAKLPYFRTNRTLFVQQQLALTMSRVLTNAQDKWYLSGSANGKARELRLLLNREIKPATTQTNR